MGGGLASLQISISNGDFHESPDSTQVACAAGPQILPRVPQDRPRFSFSNRAITGRRGTVQDPRASLGGDRAYLLRLIDLPGDHALSRVTGARLGNQLPRGHRGLGARAPFQISGSPIGLTPSRGLDAVSVGGGVSTVAGLNSSHDAPDDCAEAFHGQTVLADIPALNSGGPTDHVG